jgi:hypothetical protein
MSDMPTHKVKVKAATADEASKAAKDKCRKDGCEVHGSNMPQSLSEGEWEVEVIVTEAPKKTLKSILSPKKSPKKDEA